MIGPTSRRLAAVSVGAGRRSMNTRPVAPPPDTCRNFGIIAHIDAGKTTISERMLFYAGRTRYIGEVHDGDTVMDHMDQERQRGITIASSCVSLHWRGHQLNLIDSPGHVDFTVEVERCMRVLDGAVAVIDAVAGVQVQTETVWSQADKYRVPRIAFVNKMDRDGADLDAAVASIRERLGVTPWLLQRPWERNGKLVGVIDLVTLTAIEFGGGRGEQLQRHAISDSADYAQERLALLETIAESDDAVLETLIDSGHVTADMVQGAVRRALCQRLPFVPVLCGAAYRNIGIQPLLDAVCDYVPAPTVDHVTTTLRALVFKVVHDARRGPVALTRVYRGRLAPKDMLRVCNVKARVAQLLRIDAGEYGDMTECRAGDICAIVGLKHVRTGEVLRHWDDRDGSDADEGMEISVPQPVFFCSIEAESSRHEDDLKMALQALAMEDPSLHVTVDHDTGQTVIKGMGELHLEIVRDRLRNEFNVDATLGRMSVSYRETPTVPVSHKVVTHQVPGRPPVSVTISLRPAACDGVIVDHASATLHVGDMTGPVPGDVRALLDELVAGQRGPLLGFPLTRTAVTLQSVHASNVNPGDLRAALSHALTAAIRAAQITLLEPVVELELRCPTAHVGDISADLNRRRRGHVVDVTAAAAGGNKATILALVPLAEMIGYATTVRSISQGTAYFSTRFRSFEPVPDRVQRDLLRPSVAV